MCRRVRLLIAAFLAASVSLFGALGPVSAQQGSPELERVKALPVETVDVGLQVFYSHGYRSRAEAMGREISAARAFFERRLGTDVEIKLALLDPEDYARAEMGRPYGLPFISNGLAFLPADTESGAVLADYLRFGATASPGVLEALASIGLTYEEAAERMVDLIGLHELGHAQAGAFGIRPTQPWFNELIASFFAYAFMREMAPEAAVVWDAVTRAGREGYDPIHTSLDDLNRLYIGVGVSNYSWYQNTFQAWIGPLYETHGLGFLALVRDRLQSLDEVPESSIELLRVLEEVAPGFVAWSEVHHGPVGTAEP